MDERRFDSLTRRLATRLSRRGALRMSAAATLGAATLAQPATLRSTVAQDADTTAVDRFVSLSYYPYDGDFDEAKSTLKPLLRLMQEQPGFITISFIEDDGQIYLVTTFLDKTTSDAASKKLDDWIAKSDQSILSGTPERDSGEVFLRSDLNAGCWCSTDDDDACGTDALVCCATADDDRGICLTAATTCPSPDDESEEEDPADEATPTPTVTSAAASTSTCTGEGCSCVSGTEGACDDGLFCCGADILGGTGTCLTSCPCGSEGCACIAAEISTCDDGLICCAPGEIGGEGTCQYNCSCSGEGCACITGADVACDDGLSCCGIGSSMSGVIGVCLNVCAAQEYCPGNDGCECGMVWLCNAGLNCCGATSDGETGICQSEC